MRDQIREATGERRYADALKLVAKELGAPIDRFFEEVFVMVDDSTYPGESPAIARRNRGHGQRDCALPPAWDKVANAVTLLYPLDAALDSGVRLRLLGTKAAGLNAMTALGIPVPPGFTITTEVGKRYRENRAWPDGLQAAVEEALGAVEKRLGRRFGDENHPLLLAIRSGARVLDAGDDGHPPQRRSQRTLRSPA